MSQIEHNGVKLLVSFQPCCFTCKNAPGFRGGYGGKSNGFCQMVDAVVNRVSICDKYEENTPMLNRAIAGMKGQSKWLKRKDSFK